MKSQDGSAPDPHASSTNESETSSQQMGGSALPACDTTRLIPPVQADKKSPSKSKSKTKKVKAKASSQSTSSPRGISQGSPQTVAGAHAHHLNAVSNDLLTQFTQAPLLVAHYDTVFWYLHVQIDPQTACGLRNELQTKTEMAREVNNDQWPTITINNSTFEVLHMKKVYWAQMAMKEAGQYPWILRETKSGLHFLVNMNLQNRKDLSPTFIVKADSQSINQFSNLMSLETFILGVATDISARVDACQLRTIHLAVDILGMPVSPFTSMATLMAIESDGRKGIAHFRPQPGQFSGFSIGNSTNHRVHFYHKMEEVGDKGRSQEHINFLVGHLRGIWGMHHTEVTRVEFQFRDFLDSKELSDKGLKVETAKDWLKNCGDIMTYFCTQKFTLCEDASRSSPHAAWKAICGLWIHMGANLVYRCPNHLAHASIQGQANNAITNASSGTMINVPPVPMRPPAKLPTTTQQQYDHDSKGLLGRIRRFCAKYNLPVGNRGLMGPIGEQFFRGQIPGYKSWVP